MYKINKHVLNWSNNSWKFGFLASELVVGSGKQDNNFNITYEKFIEIDCITSSGFNPRPHDDRDDKLWE